MKLRPSCLLAFIVVMVCLGLPACSSLLKPSIIKAAETGEIDKVEQMLFEGVPVDTATGSGETSLFMAAANGHEDVSTRLMERGADPNAAISKPFYLENWMLAKGATPLMAALANGYGKIAEKLLQHGADATVSDENGVTPLMLASANVSPQTVTACIKKGANVNAATTANFSTKKKGGETVYAGTTALITALSNKKTENARILIENGADATKISGSGVSPLISAAGCGDSEMVRLLLSKGADPDAKVTEDFTTSNGEMVFAGGNALMAAADAGDDKSLQLLIDAGVDVSLTTDKNGTTPLMVASAKGNLSAVELLVAHGADVNARSTASYTIGKVTVPKGWTALSGAAFAGHAEVVEFLIENGADVNAKDDDTDIDALFLASEQGHLEVVNLLIASGANVYAETKMGTAFSMASHYGYPEIAEVIGEARQKLQDQESNTTDMTGKPAGHSFQTGPSAEPSGDQAGD